MPSIPRFARFSIVALLVVLVSGTRAQAPAPADPVFRFRAVEGYSLFIEEKADEDMKLPHIGGSLEQKFKEHLVARIDVTNRRRDAEGVEWTGEGLAQQELEQHRIEIEFNGNNVRDITETGQGKSKAKAWVYVNEVKHTFRVTLDAEYIPATMSGYTKDNGESLPVTGDSSLSTTGLRWLEEYPLPSPGLGMIVDVPFPKDECGTYLQDIDWLNVHKEHAHLGTLHIELTPLGVKEPKLIITPPDDYDTWRPRPPLETSAGSSPPPPVSVAGINLSPNVRPRIQYASFLPDDFQLQNDPQLGLNPGAILTGLSPFPLDIGWQIVPADTKVVSVRFELIDVSHYPGWCMNWPKEPEIGSEPDFDLKIVSLPTYGDHTLEKPFQVLTLNNVSGHSASPYNQGLKGTIRLGSFDGAAIGVLIATATLEDGRTITGEIKGKAALQRLLIPDRDEGVSEIAKKWRDDHAGNLDDKDDSENSPVGDGQVGDGLTVWEEYRGFYQGGMWRDNCDPKKKDLFIDNTIGASAQGGIDLFRDITHLTVHDQLLDSEHKDNRVINFNKRADRWVTDQHCLVTRLFPEGLLGVFYSENGLAEAEMRHSFGNRLGPPKKTKWVNVRMDEQLQYTDIKLAGHDTEYVDYFPQNARVAHELCHAIGVMHHGQLDEDVTWSLVSHRQAFPVPGVIYENGSPIRVFDHTGQVLIDPYKFFQSSAGQRKSVYLGLRGGQHSGDAKCVMRYHIADAYEKLPNLKTDRIHGVSNEPLGMRLCTSPDGTEMNAEDYKPQSEFGPADCGRGDCKHQFVISDKYDGPQDPPPGARRCN